MLVAVEAVMLMAAAALVVTQVTSAMTACSSGGQGGDFPVMCPAQKVISQ